MNEQDVLHVGRPNIGSHEAFMSLAREVLERSWLTNNGPLVQELEQRIAEFLQVKHCVAMSNGTIALEIAIRALGLTGEVIVPSWTFVATAHALSWQDITPVFADVDPRTHNLDPASVERMVTPRTSGIIGVHLWGRPAPVESLQEIAQRRGLDLLFDAAHAFGCTHNGFPIGRFGRCEVLSFHATKVFNTFEGGAVVTDDDELATSIRLMRNFGFQGLDNVVHPGTNGKMMELSAAMGLVNLEALPEFISANQRAYQEYADHLSHIQGVSLLRFDAQEANNYQYVVIELDESLAGARDKIVSYMHERGVRARKYFWPGCHRMEPYRSLQPHSGLVLPVTEQIASRNIVLPTGASLGSHGVERVVRTLSEALSE